MTGAGVLLAFVTLERLMELLWARRNTIALIRAGAREFAPQHYPAIVILHAMWLTGLWWFAFDRAVTPAWVGAFALLQTGRLWVLLTLGRRWTTRIIVLPGETPLTRGPFRFMRHPNYAVVIGEMAILPLCFNMPIYAILFSIANAAVLHIRVSAENAAWGQRSDAA